MEKEYNHDRTLEEFQNGLKIITENGFSPIAVTQMFFEDTFVFETLEEAKRAYDTLEDCENMQVVGFWYGKEEFLEEVREYESKEDASKVLIYWL